MSPCLTLSNRPSWASEMQSKQYNDICDAKWGPPLLSWLIWPVPVLFGRIVKTLLGMLFLVTKGLEDDWCAPMPHISPSYPKILTPWNYQCCPKATNSLWTSLSLVHHNQEASEHTPTVQGSFTSNLLIPTGSHTPSPTMHLEWFPFFSIQLFLLTLEDLLSYGNAAARGPSVCLSLSMVGQNMPKSSKTISTQTIIKQSSIILSSWTQRSAPKKTLTTTRFLQLGSVKKPIRKPCESSIMVLLLRASLTNTFIVAFSMPEPLGEAWRLIRKIAVV